MGTCDDYYGVYVFTHVIYTFFFQKMEKTLKYSRSHSQVLVTKLRICFVQCVHITRLYFFSLLCCCFRLWSHNGLMPCQLNNKKLQSFSHVCMSVKFSNYTNFHLLRISSHDYLGMVLACHYQQPTLSYEYAWYFVWSFETTCPIFVHSVPLFLSSERSSF